MDEEKSADGQYLATRLGFAPTGSLDRLASTAFIPVKREKDLRLLPPSSVYFSPKHGDHSPFKSAFTFIDFGEKANMFLRQCGVRSEPSVKGELDALDIRKRSSR